MEKCDLLGYSPRLVQLALKKKFFLTFKLLYPGHFAGVYVCAPYVCLAPRPEEGARSPGTRTTHGSQMVLGIKSLQGHRVLLTTESFLQPHQLFIFIQPMTTHPGVAPHTETGPPASVMNQRCSMEKAHTI